MGYGRNQNTEKSEFRCTPTVNHAIELSNNVTGGLTNVQQYKKWHGVKLRMTDQIEIWT